LRVQEGKTDSLSQALTESIALNDVQAGGYLGKAWKLPELLTVAMAHYPDTDYRGSHWTLAAVVGLAASQVNAVRQDFPWNSSGCELLGISVVAAEEVFAQLRSQYEGTQELARSLFGH